MPTYSFENLPIWTSTLGAREQDSFQRARDELRLEFLDMHDRCSVLSAEIPRDLPQLTVHDATHLDALWEMAQMLVGIDDELPPTRERGFLSLTPAESFVLGACFLLHDLGHSIASYSGGSEELRETIEYKDALAELRKSGLSLEAAERQALGEALRLRHASHARSLAFQSWGPTGNERRLIERSSIRESFGHMIGEIAASHWIACDDLPQLFPGPAWEPLPTSILPAEWKVDRLKVALLLRACDVIHLDARRAPEFLRILRAPKGDSANHWLFQSLLQRPKIHKGKILFRSSMKFASQEVAAWWTGLDLLTQADGELRSVDALLREHCQARLIACSIEGIESPRLLSTRIQVDGWTPIDARIQVSDVLELVSKLGGKELYGDHPEIAIRELIQNGRDAIKAHEALFRSQHCNYHVFVQIKKVGDDFHLIVEDNGIGMDEQQLLHGVLDFGKSYWGTNRMRMDHPGLASTNFESTGRYGLGFYSVFMLGYNVKILTRSYKQGSETLVLEFPVESPSSPISIRAGRPVLRSARISEKLATFGTRVDVTIAGNPIHSELLPLGRPVSAEGFAHWLGLLAPTLDVNLTCAVDDQDVQLVISANDWLTITPRQLALRLAEVQLEHDNPLKAQYYESTLDRLEVVYDETGVPRGRIACGSVAFEIEGEPESWDSTGVLTIGGFATLKLRGLFGVLDGRPTRAARDMGEPVLSAAAISVWATSQARKIRAWNQGQPFPEVWFDLDTSAFLARCGGVIEDLLPVATLQSKPIMFDELREWASSRDSLYLFSHYQGLAVARKHALQDVVFTCAAPSGPVSKDIANSWNMSSYALDWPDIANSDLSEKEIALLREKVSHIPLLVLCLRALASAWGKSLLQLLVENKWGEIPLDNWGTVLEKNEMYLPGCYLFVRGAISPEEQLIT